jgi:alanine-glyoxylate transaminase / serine-glyoxylate transaminase / serine-pyruvate transaminase
VGLKISPILVDGVCSVASEEIRFDDWGLDVVLTGSQKGLGTPPGLSILVASPRAIKVRLFQIEQIPIGNLFFFLSGR